MKKKFTLLTILLVIDVLSTYLVLLNFEEAKELNPILNKFGNVLFGVFITHLIAIFLIWGIYFYSKKKYYNKPKTIRTINFNLWIVNIFYFIIVTSNIVQLLKNIL